MAEPVSADTTVVVVLTSTSTIIPGLALPTPETTATGTEGLGTDTAPITTPAVNESPSAITTLLITTHRTLINSDSAIPFESATGIDSPQAAASASSSSTVAPSHGGSSGLSSGGIIALAVAVPCGVITIFALVGLFFWRRHRRTKAIRSQRLAEIRDYGFNPNIRHDDDSDDELSANNRSRSAGNDDMRGPHYGANGRRLGPNGKERPDSLATLHGSANVFGDKASSDDPASGNYRGWGPAPPTAPVVTAAATQPGLGVSALSGTGPQQQQMTQIYGDSPLPYSIMPMQSGPAAAAVPPAPLAAGFLPHEGSTFYNAASSTTGVSTPGGGDSTDGRATYPSDPYTHSAEGFNPGGGPASPDARTLGASSPPGVYPQGPGQVQQQQVSNNSGSYYMPASPSQYAPGSHGSPGYASYPGGPAVEHMAMAQGNGSVPLISPISTTPDSGRVVATAITTDHAVPSASTASVPRTYGGSSVGSSNYNNISTTLASTESGPTNFVPPAAAPEDPLQSHHYSSHEDIRRVASNF